MICNFLFTVFLSRIAKKEASRENLWCSNTWNMKNEMKKRKRKKNNHVNNIFHVSTVNYSIEWKLYHREKQEHESIEHFFFFWKSCFLSGRGARVGDGCNFAFSGFNDTRVRLLNLIFLSFIFAQRTAILNKLLTSNWNIFVFLSRRSTATLNNCARVVTPFVLGFLKLGASFNNENSVENIKFP